MPGSQSVPVEIRALRIAASMSMVTGLLSLGLLGLMRALTIMFAALPQFNPPYYPPGANEWARMMPLFLWGLAATGVVVGVGAYKVRIWALPAMACWLAIAVLLVFSPTPWGSGDARMFPVGFAAAFAPHVVCMLLLALSWKSLR